MYFLSLHQQIVDELTFPDTDILQIFSHAQDQDLSKVLATRTQYTAQFLQCLVQPDGTLNEVSKEFSSC